MVRTDTRMVRKVGDNSKKRSRGLTRAPCGQYGSQVKIVLTTKSIPPEGSSMAPSEQQALLAQLRDGSLAGSWTLDPARSEVVLHTRHTWGLLPLRGVFGKVSGHGTVTKEGDASGVVNVAAESVDTKNPRRDKHLRSSDFFDVANHPDFTFTAESVTPTDGGVLVDATLA